MRCVFLAFLGWIVAGPASAQTPLNLSHDLVPLGIASTNMSPNQPALDAGPLFVAGVAYANSHNIHTVVADPGAYYFLTESQPFISVFLNQVSNLTIDFQGADLYFAAVNYGIFFNACSNLIVENFTVDRLQPGYTQLRITNVDPILRQINFTVQPGWQNPTALNALLNNPAVAFANPAQTDVFVFRNGRLWENYTPMPVQQPFNDDHLIIGPSNFVTSSILSSIRPGDIAVLRVRVGLNAIVADCTSCTFRNIRVYSGMEGIDLMGPSSSSVLERVYVMPKPGTDHLISTLADGITVTQPGPNNTVHLSRSIRTLDDGISPHTWVWGSVQSVPSARTAVISAAGITALGQGRPLPVSSNVAFERASDGVIVGNAVVTAESSIATMNGVNQVTVTFDRDLPGNVTGAYLYATDPSWRGDGLRLERNTVQEQGFARGISLWGLMNTTLSGSYLRRTAMSAVHITHSLGAVDWLVPPLVGITLANNVIDGAPTELDGQANLELAAIQATAVASNFSMMPTSPNQNLTFTGNFIANAARSAFYIGSTTGANVANNYLLHPNSNPRQDRAGNQKNAADVLKPIAIENSVAVSTTANTVDSTSGQVWVTDTQYRELAAYAPGGSMRLNAYGVGALASPAVTLTDADGVTTSLSIQNTMAHALDVQLPAGAGLGGAFVTLTAGGAKYFGTLFIDSQDNIPAVNGCTYELSLSSTSAPISASSVPILVVTQAGCLYQVLAPDVFVTPGSGATGTAVISVGLAANNGAARSTTIEIAGQPVTLTQSGFGPVTAAPAALKFAAIKAGAAGGLTAVTTAQTVTVTFGGASSAWTASANQPWLQIANGSGAGAGQFTASIVNPGNVLAGATNLTATITVSAPLAPNTSTTVPVVLTIDQSGRASAAPFGQVDTPVQNASGVVGAIGVTGWTLDDVGVTGVKIYRNCLPFENQASCQTLGGSSVVFIGDAAFVAGARPDVESAFTTYPQAYRAGWGYLLLTNMLPHVPNQLGFGGQGPLTLYAFATDAEGNVTSLGRTAADHTPTAIMMANDTIAKPFGAIDTPGQGQTVSGTLANFGWVLTPDPGTGVLMPPDGSTMSVYIDGVSVGTVAYNQCRGTVGNPVPAGLFCDDDVADIFGNATPQPAFKLRSANTTRYRNLDAGRAAIGAFTIDTTTLSNGSHSLAWGVTDSAGRVEGIGSRNFVVLNSGADLAPADQLRTSNFKLLTSERTDVGQRTLDALAPAPAITRGVMSSLAGLPIATGPVWGRTGFDPATARVPVPADADGVRHTGIPELGRLELTLPGQPREESERASAAAGLSGGGAPRSAFDGFLLANGTLRNLPAGSHLDPATGVFTWTPGPGYIGTYQLAFVSAGAQVPIDVTIRPAGTVDPTQGEVRMFIDAPGANDALHGQFTIAGWALDPQAAIGSGIDAVHVWARPADSDASAIFLGAATLDGERPDVAAAFGAQFDRAGYGLITSLPAGAFDLIVYAHSARTGRWEDARVVRVTIR